MPPRRKKGKDIFEQLDKELCEHAKTLRQEFDKVASDLREKYQLENVSDKIKGLQSIKNAKLGILRNRYHIEVAIILREFKDEVQRAVAEQGRGRRARGIPERRGNSNSDAPRIRQRTGEDNVAQNDNTDEIQQNDSMNTAATNVQRTRTGTSANETRNVENQTAVSSAAGPAAASQPLSAEGSAESSAESPVKKKSKAVEGEDAEIKQNDKTTDAAPEVKKTPFQLGSQKFVLLLRADQNATNQDSEVGQDVGVLPESNGEPALNNTRDTGVESVIGLDPTSEGATLGKRKKRKSKKGKEVDKSKPKKKKEVNKPKSNKKKEKNSSEAVEVDLNKTSAGNNEESKSIASEVIEIERAEILSDNEEKAGADGRKNSKPMKENNFTSTDVVEIVDTNAVLDKNKEPAPKVGKSRIPKKKKETNSTVVDEIQPNEDVNETNEDPAARKKKRKPKRTAKKRPNTASAEDNEFQPQEDPVEIEEKAILDENKKTEAEKEAGEASSVAGPPRAGRKKKATTTEEPSSTTTGPTVRRSGRNRTPTQRYIDSAASKR